MKNFGTAKTACSGIVAFDLREKQPELREITTNLYGEKCLQLPCSAASPGGRRLLFKIFNGVVREGEAERRLEIGFVSNAMVLSGVGHQYAIALELVGDRF